MSDRLQNWNNWRYLPIGTKQREAWHELDRLYRKNKELEDRIESACRTVEVLFGGGAADEFRKSWDNGEGK